MLYFFNLICLNIFWDHALLHAIFIITRLPSKLLHCQTPFNLLFHINPNFASLKVFRCLMYVSSSKKHRTKLDHRLNKCIYLGNKNGVKWHILFDLHNKLLFISKDNYFCEHFFLFSKNKTPLTSYINQIMTCL